MQTLERAISPPNLSLAKADADSEGEKWSAVLARDSRFDGDFVFAVRSTGVFCRPSCPSRRSRRENVEFFPGPAEAERAGFRACLRCRPQDPLSSKSAQLARICDYIRANLDRKITLASLGAHLGISPFHLQRTFKQALGISPRQYVERLRLDKAKRSLRNGETVNNALYNSGFSSRSRLYDRVSKQLGTNPGTLRKGGKGLMIQYTIMDSPLGRLLIGATDQGVCAVCMGVSDSEVEGRLLEDYPEAVIGRNDAGMKDWGLVFKNYFTGQSFPQSLSLDIQATAFQWKVWKHIQSIPYGRTTSYTGIAEALGKPKSVRAVANACANNPVALIVPCHRVIGKDGNLHGYKWGLERKQTLLRHEQSPRQAENNE